MQVVFYYISSSFVSLGFFFTLGCTLQHRLTHGCVYLNQEFVEFKVMSDGRAEPLKASEFEIITEVRTTLYSYTPGGLVDSSSTSTH